MKHVVVDLPRGWRLCALLQSTSVVWPHQRYDHIRRCHLFRGI